MGINPDLMVVAEEYLANRRESNIYLLLDQTGLSELASKQLMSAVKWESLFEGTGARVPISAAPVVAAIGGYHALRTYTSLLRRIATCNAFISTVAMFASPEPIDLVLKRLIVRLDVVLSDDVNALLRFYDPRILEALVKTLSAEQAENFFGLASRWWYIDRAGKLQQIESAFRANYEKETLLRLSADQEFSLIDATEPDRVLSLLQKNVPRLIASIPTPEQHGFTARNIYFATKECGLRSTSDYVLYCALVLVHGDDFSAKPEWQTVFAKVRSQQGVFAEMAINNNDVVIWNAQ